LQSLAKLQSHKDLEPIISKKSI